jgi:glycosyltransferase involved in cell wall biosynthesis
MRIIQLITELRPAGAERIVQTLSCGLVAAGHDVTVISLRPLPSSSFVVDRLKAAGIAIHSLGMTKGTPWRGLRLRRLLREFRPDVVHAHLIHANLLSRMVRLPGVPVINTVHIAERRPGKVWHFLLDRWTLSRCTVQTCVSHSVSAFLSTKLRRHPQFFPVILNGIEPPAPLSPEEVSALRKEWGVAPDTLLIGSVGRLDWQKGYDRLLKVLAEVDKMLPEIPNLKSEIRNPKSEITNGEIFRQDLQDEPGFIQGLRRGAQDEQDKKKIPSEAPCLGTPTVGSASPADFSGQADAWRSQDTAPAWPRAIPSSVIHPLSSFPPPHSALFNPPSEHRTLNTPRALPWAIMSRPAGAPFTLRTPHSEFRTSLSPPPSTLRTPHSEFHTSLSPPPSTLRTPHSEFHTSPSPPSPLQPNSLQPSASSWTLVLLGDGPERKHLERQVATLGLRNIAVRLPGFRPDADWAMGAFDLFVMPSRYEGFGLTLIEAMSHGLPVVASEADSLPELLAGYPEGEVVSFEPGHEAEAAEAILRKIRNATPDGETQNPKSEIRNDGDGESKFHHEEHEGHEEINERFQARRMTKEYLRLYESLSAKNKTINPKS